jgi:hypothetical protein
MTYGFPDTEVFTDKLRAFPEMEGKSIYGSYEQCLDLARSVGPQAKAAIVFTNNCGGENAFLRDLSGLLNCPMAGGGAAVGDDPAVSSLPAADVQAGIFCITDPGVHITAEFENIHSHILGEYELEFTDPRILEKISGEDAADFLKRIKEEYGFSENDFEHITFSTKENVNAHLNRNDGVNIRSGRDLTRRMLLRYVRPEEVQEKIERFYQQKDAIIFGCAGLRGIMDHPFHAEGFGGFLFGEICTVNGRGDFGNLMLSRLRIERV